MITFFRFKSTNRRKTCRKWLYKIQKSLSHLLIVVKKIKVQVEVEFNERNSSKPTKHEKTN